MTLADAKARILKHFPANSLRGMLFSGALWSLVGAVSSRGCVLVSSIIIARMLGKDVFGMWGLIMTTLSMFALFASFGVQLTATKHVAELREKDPLRASRTLAFVIFVGASGVLIMSIVLVLAGPLLAREFFQVPELSGPLQLAAIMLMGMVSWRMLQGALAGFQDFRAIARINALQGVVLICSVVPLTWALGLAGVVLAMAASHLSAGFAGVLATRRLCAKNGMTLDFRGMWSEAGIFWQYALPSLLTGAITGPAMATSQAIVSRLPGGLFGLGGYNAAYRWYGIILFAPSALRPVTLPMLARVKGGGQKNRFRKTLWANIGLNGGMAMLVGLPVAALSPFILALYGPEFVGDWDLLVVLSLAAVLQAINDVITQVTASHGKMWWSFGIHIVWGAVLLGGAFLLVPEYGIRGFVWTIAANTAIHLLLNSLAASVLIRRDRKTADKTDGKTAWLTCEQES